MRMPLGAAAVCAAVLQVLATAASAGPINTILRYPIGEPGPDSPAPVLGESPGVVFASPGFTNLARFGTGGTYTAGAPGSAFAIQFNGDGAYDYTTPGGGANLPLPTDNFGLEMWVRVAANYTPVGTEVLFYAGGPSGDGWGVVPIANGFVGLFGGLAIIGDPVPFTGDWTHLALVRDDGVATLYVNGVASGASIPTAAPSVPFAYLGLGKTPSNNLSAFFTGALDDVHVFTFEAGTFDPATDLSFIAPIPEPTVAGLVLIALAAGAAVALRRRRRNPAL